MVAERVQYYDRDGKLITESLKDYTRRTVQRGVRHPRRVPQALEGDRPQAGHRRRAARTRRAPRSTWPTRSAGDFDPFDLICHVAFDQPALTRRGASRQRPQARRLHQVRRPGPRGARLPCSTSTPTRASTRSGRSRSSSSTRSPTWHADRVRRRFGGRDAVPRRLPRLDAALYEPA